MNRLKNLYHTTCRNQILEPALRGVATSIRVFVNRKEGPRSSPTSSIFSTRSAARRPHVHGACPALENEDEEELQRRREISARRGPRTRRRGTVTPLRGYFFKNNFVDILC